MMKKFRFRTYPCVFAAALLAVWLPLSVFFFSASAADASDGETTSIDSNALVTYGYLQSVIDDLKKELLAEFSGSSGGAVSSTYHDITFPKGTVLVLGSDAEVIFRGGNAIIITTSPEPGRGITDLSAGRECFSGESLLFGHIYYKTDAESGACLLVTGDQAAFTMKGTYETR